MWKTLLILLISAGAAYPQSCVRQPPPALKGVSEFACKDMSYSEAWDLLAANKIAPVRMAKVTLLGGKTNYQSRKQKILRGLRIAGFVSGIAAGVLINNGGLTDLQAAALIAGPKVLEEGIVWASGEPDEFRETPTESGFVTVYTLETSALVVAREPAPPSPPSSSPALALAMITEYRPL